MFKRVFFIAATVFFVWLFANIIGCSDGGPSSPESTSKETTSIQLPPSQFGIDVSPGFEKGSAASIGKIHNDGLDKFETINTFDEDKKILTEEAYVDLMVESINYGFAMNNDPYQVVEADIYTYVRGLLDLADQGNTNVFTGEISPQSAGDYFFSSGNLTRAEADWLIGFLEAIEVGDTPVEVQMSINQYTMEHGIPYPDTPLGYCYEIALYSTDFWGDSKRFNWRTFGSRVSDAAGGIGGAIIGGNVGGPFGARVGAGIGAIAGSTGFEAAWDVIDGMR